MGYNDFYNIMDFLGNSGHWEQVAQNMGLAQGFVEDYRSFANAVIENSEALGKVDAKGFAEVGLEIGAAASGMAEGMTDGLKEVAQK
jgi:hypothetical protein